MKQILRRFYSLLGLCPHLMVTAAAIAQTRTGNEPDPLIGEWHWFNNIIIKVEPGGRTSGDARGTWQFANNKEVERKYVLKWDGSVIVDHLVLSRDGQKLTGKNNHGHAVSAVRIAPIAAKPASRRVLAGLGRDQRGVQGSFWVSVDDSASIYVNGTKAHQANLNESRSPEIQLKTGDRVVVKLHNAVAGHRFMMAFVSTDETQVVSFRAKDFRIPPDPRIRDFSVDEFAAWTKPARQENHRDHLPLKSASNWVWADRDDGTIACVVIPEMFGSARK